MLTTPFLFKLIPAVVRLGVLWRWFTPDIPTEVMNLHTCMRTCYRLQHHVLYYDLLLLFQMLYKGELMRLDTAKRISLMVDVSHDL
ncbi:hypothetical protein Hanom_Chr00s008304g01740201 [Helianthus anomalus]